MKRIHSVAGERFVMLLFALSLASADQFLKRIVEGYPAGMPVFRCGDLFEIIHTANSGAAFSMFSGKTAFLLIATTVMLLALASAIAFSSWMTRAARWSLALLLGGGIGNWIDRLLCGSVTDYIRLLPIRFPVFNFADICITLAVMCLIVLIAANRFEYNTGEEHGTDH